MSDSRKFKKINKEIRVSLKEAIKRGRFILGGDVGNFERELASYLGSKYAIGVNTCTDALHYSLKILGVRSGNEVITTPFTFTATADAIVAAGAKPVFVDIDAKTFNINPLKIEQAITSRTRAIIVVHMYGQSVDMTPVLKIARRHRLKIIEDVAQSLGSKYKNKFCGTFGDAGCLSFYPTKNLGAFGDGGAIVTDSSNLAENLKLMRVHGARRMYYDYAFIGGSSRLHTLQAAVLRTKLKYLDWFLEKRRKIAYIYYQGLDNFPGISLPFQGLCSSHSFNYFTVRIVRGRDKLYRFLINNGIPAAIVYPRPVHLLTPYRVFGCRPGDFPEAEKAAREVLSLPIDPGISEKIVAKTVILIKKFLEKNGNKF